MQDGAMRRLRLLWSSMLACPGCAWRPVGAEGCCAVCWQRLLRQVADEHRRHPGSREGPANLGPYRGLLGRLVRAAKYRPSEALLRSLGGLLRQRLDLPAGQGSWLVVPTPPDNRRRRHRVDHAHLIATAVARGPRLLLLHGALRRSRRTRPQAGLSTAARERNLHGAIEATEVGRRSLRSARVLLVDDVLTSGATLRACRAALMQAGVSQLRVAVVALARG